MQIIITPRVTEEQKGEGKLPIAKLLAPLPTQIPRPPRAAAVGGIYQPRLAGESTGVGSTSGTAGLALTHTHLYLVHSINQSLRGARRGSGALPDLFSGSTHGAGGSPIPGRRGLGVS